MINILKTVLDLFESKQFINIFSNRAFTDIANVKTKNMFELFWSNEKPVLFYREFNQPNFISIEDQIKEWKKQRSKKNGSKLY